MINPILLIENLVLEPFHVLGMKFHQIDEEILDI
jgi:hypothetical protein